MLYYRTKPSLEVRTTLSGKLMSKFRRTNGVARNSTEPDKADMFEVYNDSIMLINNKKTN